MAQQVMTVFVDDLTGEPLELDDVETVRFGIDGTEYELDTSKASADELRQAFALYIEHGRRVGGYRRSQPQRTKTLPDYNAAEVRAWCAENGIEVNDRGRIPLDTINMWKEATTSKRGRRKAAGSSRLASRSWRRSRVSATSSRSPCGTVTR